MGIRFFAKVKGFTMVELLITMGLASVVALGVAGIAANTMKANKNAEITNYIQQKTQEVSGLLSNHTLCREFLKNVSFKSTDTTTNIPNQNKLVLKRTDPVSNVESEEIVLQNGAPFTPDSKLNGMSLSRPRQGEAPDKYIVDFVMAVEKNVLTDAKGNPIKDASGQQVKLWLGGAPKFDKVLTMNIGVTAGVITDCSVVPLVAGMKEICENLGGTFFPTSATNPLDRCLFKNLTVSDNVADTAVPAVTPELGIFSKGNIATKGQIAATGTITSEGGVVSNGPVRVLGDADVTTQNSINLEFSDESTWFKTESPRLIFKSRPTTAKTAPVQTYHMRLRNGALGMFPIEDGHPGAFGTVLTLGANGDVIIGPPIPPSPTPDANPTPQIFLKRLTVAERPLYTQDQIKAHDDVVLEWTKDSPSDTSPTLRFISKSGEGFGMRSGPDGAIGMFPTGGKTGIGTMISFKQSGQIWIGVGPSPNPTDIPEVVIDAPLVLRRPLLDGANSPGTPGDVLTQVADSGSTGNPGTRWKKPAREFNVSKAALLVQVEKEFPGLEVTSHPSPENLFAMMSACRRWCRQETANAVEKPGDMPWTSGFLVEMNAAAQYASCVCVR